MKGFKQIIAMGAVGLVSAALAVALIQPATGAGGTPKVWGVGTTKALGDFTFSSFHTVLQKSVKTPSGFLSINAMLGIEDDCSDSDVSHAEIRIRVDGKNVWINGYAFELTSECFTTPSDGVVGAPAVVKVGAGTHSVQVQARDTSGSASGLWIGSRSLSILYVADGTATGIPWPADPPRTAKQNT